jgi:cellulose synthase/poly-beta-1,6-N-acetylglucosamine synthase-like glycosyltransferase
MYAWEIAALSLYSVVVVAAFARHFVLTAVFRGMTFLRPGSLRIDASGAPSVSILIPAKDEEAVLERCLRSVLAQDYPNFEVLVIDDRSEDRTAAIATSHAAEDSRLRLLQVKDLPEGWTGKTHALDLGQREATGEWLLFVDADTTMHPACLTVALREAVDHGSDLLSVLPSLETASFWEKAIQPFAGACLMVLFPLSRVNDPKQPEYAFANGQFILIRRTAYDAIGGHAAVRDKFVEDIHLGRLVRNNGLILRAVMAPDVLSVRMYSSFSAIVRGWSRILYSSFVDRPGKLALLAAFILVFSVTAYVAIVGGGIVFAFGCHCPFVASAFALGVAHEIIQTTVFARIYALTRTPRRYLALRFLGVFVMLWILARTFRMCRTHQVVWRGTQYGKNLRSPTTVQ